MIRKDFIMRQISELIRVLLHFLLSPFIKGLDLKVVRQAYGILQVDSAELLDMDIDQLDELFKDTDNCIDKMELLAYALLSEARLSEENPDVKAGRKKQALHLLEQVDKRSDSYSLDRRFLINNLRGEFNKN